MKKPGFHTAMLTVRKMVARAGTTEMIRFLNAILEAHNEALQENAALQLRLATLEQKARAVVATCIRPLNAEVYDAWAALEAYLDEQEAHHAD